MAKRPVRGCCKRSTEEGGDGNNPLFFLSPKQLYQSTKAVIMRQIAYLLDASVERSRALIKQSGMDSWQW